MRDGLGARKTDIESDSESTVKNASSLQMQKPHVIWFQSGSLAR